MVQVLGVRRGHLGAARRTRPRAHLVRAVFRAALKVFAAAELAPFRRRLAIDLDEVQGEINGRSIAQTRAHAEAIDAGFEESGNRLLVHGPRHEDLHVLVAAEIQLPTDFADDRGEVAAARGRRVESDAREDLLSVRELPDPRGFRRDAAGLTDHPEDRRLVQCPLFVRAFEDHDRERDAAVRLRWEDAAFREGPQAHALSLQEMRDLLEATEDPPRPVVRQGTGRDLGDDIRAAPTRLLQDVERPHEVEVRRPSRPDLVRGGDVEVTTRCGLGHFSRDGYFLRLLELLHSARARDYAFAAMVSGCFAGELPRGRRGLDPTPEESTGLGCGHVVDPVVLVVGRPGTRLMAPVQTLGSTARWANVDRTYSGGITALAKKRGSERWGLRSLPRTKKDPVCFLSSASGSPIPSQERTTRVRCQ